MVENFDDGMCNSELQNVGILVSRIPDIFGENFGHFPIIDANLSIFGITMLEYCFFMTHLKSK